MKTVNLRNISYEIIENKSECFKLLEVENLITDYFDSYDYILGDYSYGKLRLKGFNNKENKNFRKINDIKGIDEYIKNYCAYGAKYFLLKKQK